MNASKLKVKNAKLGEKMQNQVEKVQNESANDYLLAFTLWLHANMPSRQLSSSQRVTVKALLSKGNERKSTYASLRYSTPKRGAV